MPIRINSAADAPAPVDGTMNAVLDPVTSDLDGAHVPPGVNNVEGALQRALGPIQASLTDVPLFPHLCAGRVGARDWADNDANPNNIVVQSPWEILYMPQMTLAIIQGQVTRGTKYHDAVQQYLDESRLANASHLVFLYMIFNETTANLTGSKHDLLISFVGAPGEAVNPSSPIDFSCAYARNAGGNLFSTFPGNFAINLTPFITADGQGRFFPQAWVEDVWPADFADPFTNLSGWFIDVFDFNPKISGTDYNGDQVTDNADDDWDNGGLSETVCNGYRAGQASGLTAIRNTQPGKGIVVNFTDHERETTFEDQSLWLNNDQVNDNYAEYKDLYDGGWIEEMVNRPGDNSFSGMDGAGNYRTFGNPRLAWNAYRHNMIYALSPKLVCPSFIFHSDGAIVDPVIGQNEVTSDTFSMMRYAFAMTHLDDGYLILGNSSNSGSRYNRTPIIDEMGLNTSHNATTGLFRGWMGAATQDGLSVREVAASAAAPSITVGSVEIYTRTYQNAAAVSIWGRPSSGSNDDPITATVLIPIDDLASDFSGGTIPGNVYKTFPGVQDTAVNDDTIINETNYPLGYPSRVMDGRIWPTI